MANAIIQLPIPYIGDFNKGRPIFNGKIFVGIIDLDPEIPANQLQIVGIQEDGVEVNLPQPVLTGSGGYPIYNGSPVRLSVDGAYSLKILDKNDNQEYYFANVLNGAPIAIDDGIVTVDTIDLLRSFEPLEDGQQISLLGHTLPGIGGDTFYFDESDTTSADNNGTIIVTSGGKRWKRIFNGAPYAEMFGALGDNVQDDRPFIQNALSVSKHVKFGPRGFKLGTPILVTSGCILEGEGRDAAFQTSGRTTFYPSTVAVQTDDFETQNVFFKMSAIGIVGGTIQVDLGLFHDIDIQDCSYYGMSVGGFVCVRGEKQILKDLRFDATNGSVFGMSIGRWEESVYGGYSDAFFAPDGPFFDRAVISRIDFQGDDSNGTFEYAIKTNLLSGSTIDSIVHHGGAGTEISSLFVRTRLQLTSISDWAPDNISSTTSMFDIEQSLRCTFIDVSPSFAGNNTYLNGFDINQSFGTTFTSCEADGDNASQFGFLFGNSPGQNAALVACTGAVYHASTNALVRAQITSVNCNWTNDNGTSIASTTTDIDQLANIMADTSGTAQATARWGAQFANGGGAIRTPFFVRVDGATTDGIVGMEFLGSFGENNSPKVFVSTNNVNPEGNLTAISGSICMFQSGTTAGNLYVKETGNGNTGWVLK